MDINKLLTDEGFSFLKRFGQNFITDSNLLNAIVLDAGIEEDDVVVEVGCGAGTLTAALARRAKSVIGFEIDERLKPILDITLKDCDNANIIFKDILKIDKSELLALTQDKPFKVVANLPYYITTPVLFYFLENENLKSITVMVQKEVAKRLEAKKGTPDYGAITAQINALGSARITRIVNRKLFVPQPNVDSAVVRIDLCKNTEAKDFSLLKKVIASAFEMRRKMLINNLTKSFFLSRDEAMKILRECQIDVNIRGEQLGTAEFVTISNALSDRNRIG